MRKILIILGLVTVLPGSVWWYLQTTAAPAPACAYFKDNRFLIMAHRGGAGLGPENTLPTLRRSLQMGANVLELDLRTSRDGVWVVFHSAGLASTTNGQGALADFTLAELKRLDAGFRARPAGSTGYPYRGQGLTIPTLAEVFEAFPGIKMNLELKVRRTGHLQALCALIDRFDKSDQVLLASFDHAIITAIRRLCPRLATAASAREARNFYLLSRIGGAALYSPKFQVLQMPLEIGTHRLLDRAFIRRAHSRGLKVHAWTINSPAQIEQLLTSGIDGVISDYPDRVTALWQNKKQTR